MIDDQLMMLKGGISALDILPDRDAASLIVHGGGSPRLRTSAELARAVEEKPASEARQLPGLIVTGFRELTGNALRLYKEGKITIEPNANTAPFLRDLITQLDVSEDDLFPLDGAKSLRLYGRDAPHVVLSGDLVSRMRRHAEIHNVDVNTVGFCLFAFVRSILDVTLGDEREQGVVRSKGLVKTGGQLVPVEAVSAGAIEVPIGFVLAQVGASPDDIFPPEDEIIRFTALTALDGYQYRVSETLVARLHGAAGRLDRSELVAGVNLVDDIVRLVDALMEKSDDPLLRKLEVTGAELFPSVEDDVEMVNLKRDVPLGARLHRAIVDCAADNGCEVSEIVYNMLEALRGLLTGHLASGNWFDADLIAFDYDLGSQLVGREVQKLVLCGEDDKVPVGSRGTVIKLIPLRGRNRFAVEIFWDHDNHWVLDDVIDFMRFCQVRDAWSDVPMSWNLNTDGIRV